jgi:hypothetical protein
MHLGHARYLLDNWRPVSGLPRQRLCARGGVGPVCPRLATTVGGGMLVAVPVCRDRRGAVREQVDYQPIGHPPHQPRPPLSYRTDALANHGRRGGTAVSGRASKRYAAL